MANSITREKREAVGRRFGLLPETCQEALLVAAAIGIEFGLETVSAVCKRRVDQVREALEREVGAGLVNVVAGASGIYRFAEPGIRDLLYEEIPPARRPWLHRQIAESLDRGNGRD
jgi:predicted ATPase